MQSEKDTNVDLTPLPEEVAGPSFYKPSEEGLPSSSYKPSGEGLASRYSIHQEIVEIHIRHYEPPKCIVDGCRRYELVIIL